MKKIILLTLIFSTLFLSCEKSMLDKTFKPELYKTEFGLLFKDKTISNKDAFLINYSIIRQRPYLGYEVEGKTYGEILSAAKGFHQIGIPVKETYDEVESQDDITVEVSKIKSTFLEREDDSSRKVKNVKFTCTFTNNTDKDVALNYVTFILNGPFKQHLMTAGFETNCKIYAGETLKTNYVVNSKKIRNNLFYGKTSKIKRLMIDDIIDNMEIKLGGLTFDNAAKHYDECFIEDQVIEPFQLSNYSEMYPDKNFDAKIINGIQTVHRGTRLYVREGDDKAIKYKH